MAKQFVSIPASALPMSAGALTFPLDSRSLASRAMGLISLNLLKLNLTIRVEEDFEKRERLLKPLTAWQNVFSPIFDANAPNLVPRRSCWMMLLPKGETSPIASCALKLYPNSHINHLIGRNALFEGTPRNVRVDWVTSCPVDLAGDLVYCGGAWAAQDRPATARAARLLLEFAQALALSRFGAEGVFSFFDDLRSKALGVRRGDSLYPTWRKGVCWKRSDKEPHRLWLAFVTRDQIAQQHSLMRQGF